MPPAIMRSEIEKIEGVKRCWLEVNYSAGMDKRLVEIVVEVQSTDPNESGFLPILEEQLRETIARTVNERTSMSFHLLRIVPSGK